MSKMTNCKACGKELAKGVKKCVHCGKDQRNFFMKHKILTVIIALVVIGGISAAAGGGNDTKSPSTPTSTSSSSSANEAPKAEVTISAVDLAKAYEDNEVKADKDYKDKLADINGKIDDIGVIAGQTFIVLSAEKDFALTQVQCFFKDKAQIDKISNLKKGDKITVEGKIDGKSMNVGVNNCILK